MKEDMTGEAGVEASKSLATGSILLLQSAQLYRSLR